MNTWGGLTTAEWVTAISAFVSAILAIVAGIDPASVLSKPTLDTAITTAFAAAVPILLAVTAGLHAHAASTKALIAHGLK